MRSRLLNGSPQLSVRVTLFPLILIVLSSTITLGTIAGTPVIIYIYMYSMHVCIRMYVTYLLHACYIAAKVYYQ